MSIRTFWIILIKILGLILISGTLIIVPQSFSSFYFAIQRVDLSDKIVYSLIILVLFFIYFLIIKLCIYKTNWIIDTLKLDRGFETGNIELNFDSTKIISIAVIVIGGLLFIENIPVLLQEVMVFFQNKNLFKDYPKSGWIAFSFCKTIIGYLLMTNSFRIAKLIEKQNKD
ncbi:hypothetical protein NJT12_05300 [Flavobacterium sp. AC]|uniref:DUF2975 domain-containing protein n=1 Tax=Flavobacterium azizsancarii TaxID=2961580 RepID=A0ABT4W910_9FLAO|nr:hypothetical protein [Flavobacterium azizsancarii]MDA6069033.1 hypothetical protein [Flavobacterium azizsancarii]